MLTLLILLVPSKFLGKSKIDPKYKQQSTLAFNNSKKPRKSKKDSDEDVDDDIVQPAKRRKVSNETKDRDDDENGLVEVEPGTADTATKTNGHLTPERPSKDLLVTDDGPGAAQSRMKVTNCAAIFDLELITAWNLENEKTDEDDEDVVKKPRRPGGTSKKNSKVNHEQDMKQVTTTAKNKSSTAKRETSKSESKNASAKRDASKRNEERSSHEKQEASDSDIGISKPRAKASKVKQINDETVEDPATASEVEDDDADSEEEDQPEVAAKAREKVQSTLKSSGKDPYPDWKPGDPVPYAALCTTFSLIEMTSKRLVISAHCSLFLRQVLRLTPDDLLHTIHLMINKLAADYAGIELGIGESLIMKAIGESTGRSLQVIKADQAEIGDLGLVAAKSRSNQPTMFKPKALTVKGVRDGLMSIATVAGHGSQEKKVAGIKKLLSAADTSLAGKGAKGVDITKDKGGASEAKFIVRFLEGKLRLGLAEKTILVALAHAMVTHETEKKDNKVPSSEQLAKGEEVLKTVYRYVSKYTYKLAADKRLVSCPATKSSYQPCFSMVSSIYVITVSCSLECP